MPIKVTCKCGRAMTLADKWAGKSVPCASCASPLQVPAQGKALTNALRPSPPPVPKSPPAAPKIPAASKPQEVRERMPSARPPASDKIVYDKVIEVPEPPPLPMPPIAPNLQAPMLITEVYDDVIEVTAGPPPIPKPAADTIAAAPPAPPPAPPQPMEPERDLTPLSPVPVDADDHAAGVAEEVHEVENLEVLEFNNDWKTCGFIDEATLELEPESTAAAADEHAAAAYQVRDDDPLNLTSGAVGFFGAMRLPTECVTSLAYGADHVTHLATDDEIYFLDWQARTSAAPFRPMHDAPILCIASSPDCRLALSGDAEGALLLSDLAERKAVRWLDGHRGEINAVAFSPDGRYAASGGVGGAVRLWTIPSGEAISLDEGQLEQGVNCVCFSPESQLLCAIGAKGRARLWKIADGRLALRMRPGFKDLDTAAFSRDGSVIVASHRTRFQVCKWNVADGERVSCFQGVSSRVRRVERTWVTPHGNGLIVVRYELESTTPRYDETAAELDSVARAAGLVRIGEGTFVPDLLLPGSFFAAAMRRDANLDAANAKKCFLLERWDMVHEVAVSKFRLLGPPHALGISPDGHRVLLAMQGGVVGLCGT